jgi:hypothetical protein
VPAETWLISLARRLWPRVLNYELYQSLHASLHPSRRAPCGGTLLQFAIDRRIGFHVILHDYPT